MAYNRKRLNDLGASFRELREALDDLRPALAAEIRAAHAAGVRQIDIVNATGYTRELVRRIVRADDMGLTRGGRRKPD
jgi:hypothetical protein